MTIIIFGNLRNKGKVLVHMFILISAGVALFLTSAVVLLLRTFSTSLVSHAESFDEPDFSWRDYPVSRLLDPADFDFLRSRGIDEARIRKLRTERRKIFRLCLRSLAREFNQVQVTLKIAIMRSTEDRPGLATFLAKQKMVFYRNLLLVEGSLVLHACDFDRMPAVDLLLPLRTMQAQLRQLAVLQSVASPC